MKLYPTLDVIVEWIGDIDKRKHPRLHAFRLWLTGLSLRNKLEELDVSFTEFCDLMVEGGCEKKPGKRGSFVFTLPGQSGKVVIVPGIDERNYRLEFTGRFTGEFKRKEV